jgi:SOS-response transcriptional repressor LexA
MDATHRLPAIVQFYRRQQRMPSLGELQRLYGFKSRTAAEKVAGRLVTLGLLAKDKTGRLLPTPAFSAVRLLGAVEAGFPSPAEEELRDTIDLDEFLIRNKEATYIVATNLFGPFPGVAK